MRELASTDRPGFTPDELLALIEWLPDDSATSASVAGGKHFRGWGQDRWLLKSILDSNQINGVIAMKIAAGKKAGKVKLPEPWPSPEQQLRLTNQLTPKAPVARLRSHFG